MYKSLTGRVNLYRYMCILWYTVTFCYTYYSVDGIVSYRAITRRATQRKRGTQKDPHSQGILANLISAVSIKYK